DAHHFSRVHVGLRLSVCQDVELPGCEKQRLIKPQRAKGQRTKANQSEPKRTAGHAASTARGP
ncbi:MAG: hypothetical protein ACK462_02270, partial [Planctomyces sp.]